MRAADETTIAPAALAQIKALIAEKEARSPAQRKIDSQLLYAAKMARGVAVASGVATLETAVEVDAAGLSEVEIRAKVSNELRQLIKRLGGKVLRQYPLAERTIARMPIVRLEELASDASVVFIRRPARARLRGPNGLPASAGAGMPTMTPRVQRFRDNLIAGLTQYRAPVVAPGEGAVLRSGSAESQGDKTHRAVDARSAFSVNGAGIRIGVLSDSFNNLNGAAADAVSGDLPGPGNPDGFTTPVGLAGSGDFNYIELAAPIGTDEGRAMLQIVHDLAPGAQLYFATAFVDATDFADNIRALRGISPAPGPYGNIKPGCDIILDDVGYTNETGLHDGQLAPSDQDMAVITQAVNDVVADGALFFSAAGNDGSVTQGSASAWEGDYVPGTKPGIITESGDALAWVVGTVGNTIPAGTAMFPNDITMQWSDPIGGSNNDYDLFLLNNSMSAVVASSTNTQSGTQDPFEEITTNSGGKIVVVRNTGVIRFISLSANGTPLQFHTHGQTRGHSAPPTGFGVAATPASTSFGPPTPNGPYPNPFVATNQVENFSSDGPRRSFFNADGTPITPGNFLASTNGGVVRQKPDFTAADGVSVTTNLSSLNPFYGTSAATPHAAAIAALVKQSAPGATSTQLQSFLRNTSIDIMGAGLDDTSGYGILQAFQAVQAAITPQANLSVGTVTVTSGNNRIDPSDCNSLNVALVNNGTVQASSISATLTTSTPGVMIIQGISAYPTMAAGGASATNATPFQVSTTPAASCGTVSFTLTVTYSGGPSPKTLNFTLPIGQDPNNYVFTQSGSGGTIPGGGSFVSGSNQDDGVVNVTTPFAFQIYGTTVSAGTAIEVSTNGNIRFVSAGFTDLDSTNSALPAADFPSNAPTLFPYWVDLDLETTGGGIYTNTIGSAPNRQFVIEWRGQNFGDTPGSKQTVNFAVIFNENSSQFQFVYPQTGVAPHANASGATVGVQLANSGTSFTQFAPSQAVITAGSKLSAALGQCTAGSGPCNSVAPVITSSPPPNPVTVGTPYSYTITASGNPAPTFAVTAGTLPPGLALSTAGVLSGTATSAGSGLFSGITVTASNGILPAPNSSQTFGLQTVTVAANYIASFGLTGANAAFTADPDGDGLPNLLEYAFGADPTGATANPAQFAVRNIGGMNYLSVIFPRSSVAADITYIVEVTNDLSTNPIVWTELARSTDGGATSGIGFVSESGGPPTFQVEVRDNVPVSGAVPPQRFMRVRVTTP